MCIRLWDQPRLHSDANHLVVEQTLEELVAAGVLYVENEGTARLVQLAVPADSETYLSLMDGADPEDVRRIWQVNMMLHSSGMEFVNASQSLKCLMFGRIKHFHCIDDLKLPSERNRELRIEDSQLGVSASGSRHFMPTRNWDDLLQHCNVWLFGVQSRVWMLCCSERMETLLRSMAGNARDHDWKQKG